VVYTIDWNTDLRDGRLQARLAEGRPRAGGGGTRIVQTMRIVKLPRWADRLYYRMLPTHRDRSELLRADLERLGEVAEAG
jgi:hypothetical protein